MTDEVFPEQAFTDAGLYVSFVGQKRTTASPSSAARHRPRCKNLPNFEDEQKRVICATINDVRIVNAYIVNGQSLDSDKFVYKLNWLAALIEFLAAELKCETGSAGRFQHRTRRHRRTQPGQMARL